MLLLGWFALHSLDCTVPSLVEAWDDISHETRSEDSHAPKLADERVSKPVHSASCTGYS